MTTCPHYTWVVKNGTLNLGLRQTAFRNGLQTFSGSMDQLLQWHIFSFSHGTLF
jgi:hypothetical protein